MLYSPLLGLLMQMIRSSSVISIFANRVFLVTAEEGALNSTANEGCQNLRNHLSKDFMQAPSDVYNKGMLQDGRGLPPIHPQRNDILSPISINILPAITMVDTLRRSYREGAR